MREIKFRFWHKTKKRFMDDYGYPISFANDGEFKYIDDENIRWEDEHIIVIQFTGLKDKNGKEIYEGDIIEWKGEEIVEVRWDDKNAQYGRKGKKIIGIAPLYTNFLKYYEVIGNIYKNKELIK